MFIELYLATDIGSIQSEYLKRIKVTEFSNLETWKYYLANLLDHNIISLEQHTKMIESYITIPDIKGGRGRLNTKSAEELRLEKWRDTYVTPVFCHLIFSNINSLAVMTEKALPNDFKDLVMSKVNVTDSDIMREISDTLARVYKADPYKSNPHGLYDIQIVYILL